METLQRTANRGSVSTGPYAVDNSCKFEADNTEYLHRTVSSEGNRDIGTISCWVKRTELGAHMYLFTFGNTDSDTGRTYIKFENTDTLKIAGGSTVWRETSRVFRDVAAWYHIVVAFDTSQSTANDRIKLYINGVQETSFATTNNPAEDADLGVNFEKQTIGYNSIDNDSPFSGYMAEICYQDGTASAATEFGETDSDTGIWIAKDVSGQPSGTNKFFLDFQDSSNMGNDASGGTDFTENNIAAADQATDTPSNNFCTLNPLIKPKYAYSKMSEGATVYDTSTGGVSGALGTFAVTAGKWYWECKLIEVANHYIGVSAVDDGDNFYAASDPQDINSTFQFAMGAARIEYFNGGSKTYGSVDQFTDVSANDICGIALNMDDNQITLYINGTEQTNVDDSSLYDAANKMCAPFHGTIDDEVQYNFGGYCAYTISSAVNDANGYGTFEYAPPSGYYALCTKNLSEFGG